LFSGLDWELAMIQAAFKNVDVLNQLTMIRAAFKNVDVLNQLLISFPPESASPDP